jgi:hypothetical protein
MKTYDIVFFALIAAGWVWYGVSEWVRSASVRHPAPLGYSKVGLIGALLLMVAAIAFRQVLKNF